MTMIVLEELIKAHKLRLAENGGTFVISQPILDFTEGIERLILQLLEFNYDKRYERASMPYSEGHRVKVRLW